MNMDHPSDFMFSTQLPPSIRPQVQSSFNIPYLTVEDNNSNPLFDATPALTSLPFDQPQDLNLTKIADETLGTPSSTVASEGLGFHVCDVCSKVLKSSDFRYVSSPSSADDHH